MAAVNALSDRAAKKREERHEKEGAILDEHIEKLVSQEEESMGIAPENGVENGENATSTADIVKNNEEGGAV